MFINYINNKTPENLLQEYHKQHRIFVTSVLASQPDSIASLITGDSETSFFVDGLEKLREVKKQYPYPIFYLDNDCILLNPVDELQKWDFDVAVVYRHRREQHGGFQDCLGGFLFFSNRRPEKEDLFLRRLIKKTEERYNWELTEGKTPWYYDQLAINDLVGRPPIERNKESYLYAEPYEPCLKNVDGVKVLFLSANEWACPMAVNLPEKVKIIHYNHANWIEKYKKDADGIPFFRGKIQSA